MRAEGQSRKPSLLKALLKTFWKRSAVHAIAFFLCFCVFRLLLYIIDTGLAFILIMVNISILFNFIAHCGESLVF